MESRVPRFSIISAAYDVARFLPEFIASVEAQAVEEGDLEVIMVDDGSTDETAAVLDAWRNRRPSLVQVVHQPNAGQGAARNLGLSLARGQWVTFPDPDDKLDRDYLRHVSDFIDENPATDLVATHRWLWPEGEKPANTHPLRLQFTADRLVDLPEEPAYFHGSAPASFFRRSQLVDASVSFDTRIRPNFEDGHFTARYLLACERPRVGFLKSARYYYRKRADSSSTLDRSRSHPGRYAAVMRHGYLDLVARCEAAGGVPPWLQHFLVYELSYYFNLTDSQSPADTPTSGAAAQEFNDMVDQIVAAIDVDQVVPYVLFSMKRNCRYAIQHGLRGTSWREPAVTIESLDQRQQLARVTYYYCGRPPVEELRCDGQSVRPQHAKTRSFTYYGRPLLHERILWLPARQTNELRLDGHAAPFQFERTKFMRRMMIPRSVRWQLSSRSARQKRRTEELTGPVPTSRLAIRAQRHSQRPRVRARYADAWVLMDRIHDAGDSGEILFRYLRSHHPGINAWFVLEKGTPDWKRLRAQGYGDRMVAHGSTNWLSLMAHCRHLISSHADAPVISPPAVMEFVQPNWKFTFLQHGVIKDDLSAWLAGKQIDTFVTSSRAEHASIVGDGTPYPFTTKETVNTGLPRFDRLLEIGRQFPSDKRDLVLLAPTWRNWLVDPILETQQRRTLEPSALDSEFVRQWMRLMEHPALEQACNDYDLSLGFLPHPNLQSLIPHLSLAPHVHPLTYAGNDVQTFFARSRVLVTDFSSVAFNSAYLERPTVYYQFDEERVLGGGHVGRGGYFDYRRDGFGPVATSTEDAVAAILQALSHGPDPLPEYRSRIEATFPMRDGHCCARVVAAIKKSDQPQSGVEPLTPAPNGDAA